VGVRDLLRGIRHGCGRAGGNGASKAAATRCASRRSWRRGPSLPRDGAASRVAAKPIFTRRVGVP